ncbi:hypothetical protein F511_19410 [Dorcoceras hygrometricum]|uniref:Uncharacterized protein n=1 Tax=Dorcoceras hygrometricum TaxID=472368 RepID=A0A2Z7AE79_9LAMI|nr:hypothetical protein F511_19410 [Dorcoceras hygrometricum]
MVQQRTHADQAKDRQAGHLKRRFRSAQRRVGLYQIRNSSSANENKSSLEKKRSIQHKSRSNEKQIS